MDDLEQQIRAWVDAEAEGVGPVTVADVFARGDAPAPSTTRVLSSRRRSTTVTSWPRWKVGLNGAICLSRLSVSSWPVQEGTAGMS